MDYQDSTHGSQLDKITGGLEGGLGYRLVSDWELVVSIKEGEVVVG